MKRISRWGDLALTLTAFVILSGILHAQVVYNGVHVIAGSTDQAKVDSAGITTTNSSLLLACAATSGATNNAFSDNKGNTWVALTPQAAGFGAATALRGYYAINPNVGTGHIFSLASVASSFPSLVVIGFSGTASSAVLDAQNGVSNTTFPSVDTTQAVGSITPSAATNLMATCITFNNAVTSISINSSYIITDSLTNDGNHFALSMAYKLLPSGAQNPTFSWTTADSPGAIHASFKAGTTSGSSSMNLMGAGR